MGVLGAFSLTSWTNSHIARQDARRQSSIVECAVRLVDAPEFDSAALASLTPRERFSVAAATLRNVLYEPHDSPDPIAVLADRHSRWLWPWRMAHAFRALKQKDPRWVGTYTIGDLREHADSTKPRADRAREALAALGEINWYEATRRERAAFLLHELAQARERVS